MKVALDTTVLVSAVATRGLCSDIVNLVLAAAVAGDAEVLVTGDRDLLGIAGKSPVRILTPREMWVELTTGAAEGHKPPLALKSSRVAKRQQNALDKSTVY